MNNQDYDQKKQECWAVLKKQSECEGGCLMADAFFHAFDRAYALGKEKETITQDYVEKAANEYANSLYECGMYDKETLATKEDMAYAFKAGANFALGKQEKDADDPPSLLNSKEAIG